MKYTNTNNKGRTVAAERGLFITKEEAFAIACEAFTKGVALPKGLVNKLTGRQICEVLQLLSKTQPGAVLKAIKGLPAAVQSQLEYIVNVARA